MLLYTCLCEKAIGLILIAFCDWINSNRFLRLDYYKPYSLIYVIIYFYCDTMLKMC